MHKQSNKHIKIVPIADQEVSLDREDILHVVKKEEYKGQRNKRVIIGLGIVFFVITIFALVYVVGKEQVEDKKVEMESHSPVQEDQKPEKITNEVQSQLISDNDAPSFIPLPIKNQENNEEKQEKQSQVQQQQTNKHSEPYKKLINRMSTVNTKPGLKVYIKRRGQTFKEISAGYQNQDKRQKITQNLNNFNLTFEQFRRALTLVQHAPFLEVKQKESLKIVKQEQQYYEKHYNISVYEELPMCVVIPSFRNFKRYRYFYNLYTILQQQYDNYHAIIIDDNSDDRTAQNIEHELNVNELARKKVTLIKNKEREHHMSNIYKAVYQYCKKGQILLVIDGDDQLIGKYVFKLINAAYHRMKSLAIYTNHIQSKRQNLLDIGISRAYSQQVKRNNSYRFQRHYYSHLRSTWVDLFLLIQKDAFRDSEGKWFTNAVDNAMFYPIFQMSCGEVQYLPEITYKYNTYTGFNVDNMEEEFRRSTSQEIRAKKTYSCLKDWNPEAFIAIKGYMK